MATILFAVECWLATLLWTALLVAWYARRRKATRLVIALLASLLLLVPWLLSLFLLIQITRHVQTGWLLSPLIVLTALGILGAMGIWRRGLKSNTQTQQPIASTWPGGRLFVSAVVVTVLAQSTLWMIQAQTRERIIDIRREAQVLAESASPRRLADAENAATYYYQVFDAMGSRWSPPMDSRTYEQLLADEEARPKLDATPEEPGVPDFRTQYWIDVVGALSEPDPQEAPFDFNSPRLGALLDRNRGVRQLILQGAKAPGCNFHRDFTRPSIDTLLYETNEVRAIARFLWVDACYAAARGDDRRAAEDIDAAYHLASHTAEEPWLVSMLVGIAIEGQTNEVFRRLLSEMDTAPTALLNLQLAPRLPWTQQIARSLRMEEATMLMSLTDLNLGVRQVNLLEPSRDGLVSIVPLPILQSFFFDTMTHEARIGFRDLHDVAIRLLNAAPGALQRLGDLSDAKDRRHSLADSVVPGVNPTFHAALRGDASRCAVHVAQALYRYYDSTGDDGKPRGKFPASLSELVPDYLDYVPSDPFTNGLPLRYMHTESSAKVYSIGSNLQDDRGAATENPNHGDLVMECPAPRSRSNASTSQAPAKDSPAEGEPSQPAPADTPAAPASP